MNKRELQGAFSKIHASDELIKEVVTMKSKERKPVPIGRILWKAGLVAAVLAIMLSVLGLWPAKVDPETGEIIAVPGGLKVYAYEVKDNMNVDFQKLEEYVFLENQVYPLETMYNPFTNHELAFTPVVDDEILKAYNLTFEVATNQGQLVGNYHDRSKYSSHTEAVMGKEAVIQNADTVYWEGRSVQWDGTPIYIELILKADDHIVGFAIFEIIPLEEWDNNAFTARLIKTMFYPLIDGAFQNITDEYILSEIEGHKA